MSKAIIHYHDIGDYLSREEKLATIKKYGSVDNMPWETLTPNEHGDWLNQRNDVFGTFISIGDKTDKNCFFNSGLYCRGLETSRDAWVYNSSRDILNFNIIKTINFFNEQSSLFVKAKSIKPDLRVEDFVIYNDSEISWSRAFLAEAANNKRKLFNKSELSIGLYRPFFKQDLYFSREINNVVSRMDSFFPTLDSKNLVICVSGLGGSKENTTIITNYVPDLNCLDSGTQCFPLYYFEERLKSSPTLFDDANENEWIQRDGVSDFIFTQARKAYGNMVGKEDIFYYVYGFLHCPEYRLRFTNDLKKMLPRIPLVDDAKDFWSFSKAGRKLAELHINYESVPAYNGVNVSGIENDNFKVEKMRFPKKDQKDMIFYNSNITISNIPAEAYEYIVNGKSAIEWIMERYQITTHKESGIRNDPNDWATEVGNPRYILDLLLSIINVSVQTVQIVKGLPEVRFE